MTGLTIVHFTNSWKPMKGGVPVSVDLYTDYLRRRGHRVFVVAPEYEEAKEDPPWVFRVPAIKNFRGSAFSVPYPQHLNFKLLGGIERLNPHVIHVHHPFLLGEVGLRIARRMGIPCVFTYHTLYHKYTHYLLEGSDALKKIAVFVSVFFASLCDRVIAPSESVRQFLLTEGVRAPVTVLPTGIEDERVVSRRLLPSEGEAFRLVYSGRLEPEKNLEFLFRAVALFLRAKGDAELIVVGDGRLRREVEKLAGKLRVRERVKFVGEVEREELFLLLDRCHLFVFASKTETQGLVVLEAMARGLPVVCLPGPGVVDVVRNGVNGLLPEEREESFAESLRVVAEHPEIWARLSRGAILTARKHRMGSLVRKLESLYKEVISGRERKRSHSSRIREKFEQFFPRPLRGGKEKKAIFKWVRRETLPGERWRWG
ncbi:MAG: glycosyltransferase family 4 protein [Deltaproteobacteria bacterium]|nr:MAG: glycosyltransferase family 4 protein [Deltaproteobacteria bacterium]